MKRSKGIIQLLPLLIVAFLVVGLIAVTSSAGRLTDFLNKAASGGQSVVCWNRIGVDETGNGPYYWPDYCRGNPEIQVCAQAIVELTPSEVEGYKQWISEGKPFLPGCNMASPTPGPAATPNSTVEPTPKPEQATPTPSPTCKPRPSCLDAVPRCLLPETSDMCPRPTVSPSPTSVPTPKPKEIGVTPTPSSKLTVPPNPTPTSTPHSTTEATPAGTDLTNQPTTPSSPPSTIFSGIIGTFMRFLQSLLGNR